MRHHVWVFSVLILLLITTLDHAQAEQDEYNSSVLTKNGLVFSLTTDKKVYNHGEPVKISWKVTNIDSEDVSYIRTSSCSDGFNSLIFDSDLHDLSGLLGENALLIPQNDPNLSKFGSKEFYGTILKLTETDPTRPVGVLIITPEADKLRKLLRNEYDITELGSGGFVGARVMAKDIPQIAKSELVREIMDGDARTCADAEFLTVLEPNQSIERGFSWSQLVVNRDKSSNPIQVPNGYYSVQVSFNNTMANCVIIGVGDSVMSSIPEIPCGLWTVPSGITKKQIIDLYNQTRMHPKLHGVSDEIFEDIIVYLQNNDSRHEIAIIGETQISTKENSESKIQNTTNSELLDTRWYNPETLRFHPPLIMMKNGLEPADLICNEPLNKLYKPNSDVPVCMRPQTLEKLVERGWLTVPYSYLTK